MNSVKEITKSTLIVYVLSYLFMGSEAAMMISLAFLTTGLK